jgi:hypothetical protein
MFEIYHKHYNSKKYQKAKKQIPGIVKYVKTTKGYSKVKTGTIKIGGKTYKTTSYIYNNKSDKEYKKSIMSKQSSPMSSLFPKIW